ncbi:WecB/TagA/CpsF family glycosyltransferase [Marinithermus hydrothermalis]|uniref:Glycosyl transferase, WecB/TagA/CpsF family n=1 Tax=Marinithermus hydrothermalis (strain DSM 14884 / JCM 11576 / T1) TaxID=869210 RepID=F2NQY0_MARHT|nr:WecB/TagA/CpsF family glycosyltransferase [Marinithermus hydrothermalis]AEB12558.1 glycosyl transferase, WecB/TagA/CpsF family [Marinithermus hydrothermalis DSM 14884]
MARVDLLGVEVDLLTMCELNKKVYELVSKGKCSIVANHNLHSIYLFHRDKKMRLFYSRASVIHIDGMALVMWGRLLGLPLRPEHRIAYIDWIYPLMEMASTHGWRVFYLGGEPGVAELAANKLKEKYPCLQIRTHHGYFDWSESDDILKLISEWSPQLLLVGMGMPRQEHWVIDFYERISANVILNAGACFDYLAGAKPTPPRWLGKIGLEWLYRLFTEPKRLFKRYLVEPWFLIPLAVQDLVNRISRGRTV